MSSIASVGGANSAWAGMSSSRASAMKERMFGKADADGSGGVDKAELQTLFDKIAKKTGTTAADAETQLSKMDSDGDGSLGMDELDTGMKSLMPPPKSTVDFAQQRSADKDAALSDLFSKLDADGSGGLDATELKPLTDKLAADGTDASGSASSLSAEADAAVFKALDADGDGLISKGELSTAVSGQGDGQPMRPDGPPPGGASGGASGGGAGASSSSATDPLDTNEDGVVSAQERAAGAMKDVVQTLINAMDSDGDGNISKTEAADFKTQMESAFSDTFSAASSHSAATSTSSSSSSSSDSASTQGGGRKGLDLRALRDLVQQEYSKAAANYTSTSTVSLAA